VTVLECRFCQTSLRRSFVDLGFSPLANSYVPPEGLHETEAFYPLHVYVCETCQLVQLPAVQTPEHIFSDYAYFSSYSGMILEQAEAYVAQMVDRYGFDESHKVVEVASNDGYLLQYFTQRGVPVLGVEPAENVAAHAERIGIPTVVKFFGEETAKQLADEDHHADLIIANNVFAHVPDVNDFVGGMKILLKRQGMVTVEVPHLMQLVAHNQFDTIYHEHFSYYSFLTAQRIFAEHGLTLFDVEEIPTHGGSLRLYARHTDNEELAVTDRVESLVAREIAAGYRDMEVYETFARTVAETKRNLLRFLIEAKEAGKTVVGYAAPAKASTLLNYCGVRSDLVDYIADHSPHKQNHYLPGVHIPIEHPDRVAETRPDYLLILAWNLREEIMEQMSHVRDWGGQFVVPIPEVKVFS